MAIQLDREGWLIEAAGFILDDIFAPAGIDRPERAFRVSVGFPSNRGNKNGKVIASCWKAAASADGANEIFVSPTESDSVKILASLVHELVHYVDDCEHGHRGPFASMARSVGLAGPLTATTAGAALADKLAEIVETLGPIPHAKLDPGKSGVKKQGTRMLKVECTACGFLFRATQTHIKRLRANAPCPGCHLAGKLTH